MKSKLLPIIILPLLVFSGCSPITEYIDNLTSPERKDLVVYKTSKTYDDTQFDLIVPPDLINPSLIKIIWRYQVMMTMKGWRFLR